MVVALHNKTERGEEESLDCITRSLVSGENFGRTEAPLAPKQVSAHGLICMVDEEQMK